MSSSLITIDEAARLLGITPKWAAEKLREHDIHRQECDGVDGYPREAVERLKSLRRTRGRPRKSAAEGDALPGAAPETLRAVVQALEYLLLSEPGRDQFAKAPHGRIRLTNSTLGFTAVIRAYLEEALGTREISAGFAEFLLLARLVKAPVMLIQDLHAQAISIECAREQLRQVRNLTTVHPSEVDAILCNVPAVSVLTRHQGVKLDQVALFYGQPGSLKSRTVCTLAVLCAIETQRPVLYYAIEERVPEVAELMRHTAHVWRSMVKRMWGKERDARSLSIVPASEAVQRERPQAEMRIHGLVGNWAELRGDIEDALRACPEAIAVVVDSLGPFGEIERAELTNLLTRIDTAHPKRIVIFVAEETDDPRHRISLEHARAVADLVVRLGSDQVGSQRSGPITRFLEIQKSRRQPMLNGKHTLTLPPDGQINIHPSVWSWDAMPYAATPDRHRAYMPGFTLPACTIARPLPGECAEFGGYDGLAPLQRLVQDQWAAGCSLALAGDAGTYKDVLGLHAAAHALCSGRSAIMVNLRPSYSHTLPKTVSAHEHLQRVLTGQFRAFYPNMGIGSVPELQIMPLDLASSSPEELLSSLYAGVLRSYDKPHPVGLVVLMHFSELISLPRFQAEPFEIMLWRMLFRLKVASIVTIDRRAWEANRNHAGHPDLLATVDARLDLESVRADDTGNPVVSARRRTAEVLVGTTWEGGRACLVASPRPPTPGVTPTALTSNPV